LTIVFIPISGWYGDNLVEAWENMSWFTSWTVERKREYIISRTLWQALDALIRPDLSINKSLRLPLDDVYKTDGIGTVPVGRIATGVLKPNMIVNFAPLNLSSPVKSIETCGVFDVKISLVFI
jgi:elongation factor 1-alpha